jgi:hypothetical protein
VDFRLVVDATGKPTDCAVLTMEAIDDFIRATCDRLMKRARFQPARDTHGNAVTGVYVNSVLWIVPSSLGKTPVWRGQERSPVDFASLVDNVRNRGRD